MQGQIQRGDLNVQADFWSMESGAGPLRLYVIIINDKVFNYILHIYVFTYL